MAQNAQTKRIIGKNALIVTLSGPNAGAAQIYNYDLIREVRMDLDNFEVTVLMTYDDAYLRVFQADKSRLSEEEQKQLKLTIVKFYNDLITAAMKFSEEELKNLQSQHEELKKKYEEAKIKFEEEKLSKKDKKEKKSK